MHEIVKEAEEILDKEYSVLNHGFVRLVDYMGSDSAIVQAARVSYGKGTKKINEDKGLIKYLMRNNHTSPFEMVELKFNCKMPIFVARQWVRHRSASINEISGRYSEMKDEFYIPESKEVNYQSKDNKQGRSDETFSVEEIKRILTNFMREQQEDYKNYNKRVEQGMAKELARINLPLSLYTEWYWKIDLHNLFHFLELRMDKHAQFEIRKYANTIFDITKKVAPISCEAFEDYRLNSVRFSKQEISVIKEFLGEVNIENNFILSRGEKFELEEKLNKFSK